MYRLKVQTIFLESSWYVILDEYITLGSKLVQNFYPSWILERQSQGFFVAIDLFLSVDQCLTIEPCRRSHLGNTPLRPVHCGQCLLYTLHREGPMPSCRHHELGARS